MKRLLQTLIFFFFVSQICFAQWFWQNPFPQGNDLNAVEYISINNVIAIGENGTIIKSTNKGIDWTIINIETDKHLESISFVDNSTGWAVGENGTIIKTTDEGETWDLQSSLTTIWLRGVCFIDQNTGTAVGDSSIILRTTNGGIDWEQQEVGTTRTLYSVCFTDANNGIAVGYGIILRTEDGGANWEQTLIPSASEIYSVDFCDANNGMATAFDAGVYKTTNGGLSWSLLNGAPHWKRGICMIDENTATVVGGGGIYRTTNAGINWIEQNKPQLSGDYLFGVSFFDTNNGIAVGGQGTILKTVDGGTNWILQSEETATYNSDVNFVDEYAGWITAGSILGSMLLHTTDGGNHWIQQTTGQNMYLTSVCFIDANTGTVVGFDDDYNYGILRTIDGGENWTNQFSTTDRLQSVDFADLNNGTVVGGDWGGTNGWGTILRTTDGGANWILQQSGADGLLNCVSFINNDVGWVAGLNTILHTTDGGITWIPQTSWLAQTQFNIGILNDIHFTDAFNGTAVGYTGLCVWGINWGLILHTTDGGDNWTVQEDTDIRNYYGVSFINANTGYVVGGGNMGGGDNNRSDNSSSQLGYNSPILKTTDGCETWTSQITVSTNLLSICFTDENNGTAVGTGGTILRTTNGGTSFVEEKQIFEIPTSYLLSNNYPNPFNPSTKIKYSVPQASQVQIKVFDVLGNEIETLVNEEKPAGTYELTWNAADLPSGVYFYQLRAGTYVETKKMLLLK